MNQDAKTTVYGGLLIALAVIAVGVVSDALLLTWTGYGLGGAAFAVALLFDQVA